MLEDGRVIQEDVPEVTVDTTEDRQSHVESDIEDRDIANNDWEDAFLSPLFSVGRDRLNILNVSYRLRDQIRHDLYTWS